MKKMKKDIDDKKAKKRKIISIIAIVGLSIDLIILMATLSFRIKLEMQNRREAEQTLQYQQSAEELKNQLVSIINDSLKDIDNDEQYPINNIASFMIDQQNKALLTGYNEQYVVNMSFDFSIDDDVIKQIMTNNIISKSLDISNRDTISNNPLLSDNDFLKNQYSQMHYVIGKNDSSIRNLSATYYDYQNDRYETISNYAYEMDDFHYQDITNINKASYTLKDNPVIYYLLSNI